MKPCYIYAQEGMHIKLDGPALSVSTPGKAAVLMPLSRISRVVISGQPECSTAAILACAERGIAVTFLQYDGTVKAHLFGHSQANNNLFQHLQDLLDRPDWSDRYQTWLDAAASRARRALCRKLALDADHLSLKQISEMLDYQIERFVSTGQRHYLQRRLHGLSSNLINEVLQQAGLDATRSRYLEPRMNIPEDFANLLVLSLQLPLIQWLKQQTQQDQINDRELVALFEKESQKLERIARTLTARLHNFLVDLI